MRTLRVDHLACMCPQGSAPECEPIDPPSLWENKMKSWMERYEEASSNQYSEEVRLLLRVKEARDGKTLAYNTHTAAFKPPVEVLHTDMRKLHYNISLFDASYHTHYVMYFYFYKCIIFIYLFFFLPESSTEKQANSEGRAGFGCRFANN